MKTDVSMPSRAMSLRNWYQRPLGQQLAAAEAAALAAQLPMLFGYHMVVIDPPWGQCRLDDSRIPHHVIQSVGPLTQPGVGLSADTENWPIMTDSIDAIVLPHTLELSNNPHQVLREADRSLIPDGHLVILGFNPFSLWGLRRKLTRRSNTMPWGARFQSLHRIKDWLGLLGFDTLHSHYLFQRPPVRSRRVLARLQFMDRVDGNGYMLLSASYILVARKRTVIMTPLRESLRPQTRLFPVGIPSSNQGNVRRFN
ncbi:MAG: methyltransferase domain-containing protein [Gammaproteobacteria bacterium]